MRLKPLYRLRLTFSERWSVSVLGDAGKEDQVLTTAEGTAEGELSGRFRATDYPRRRTDGAVLTDLRGVLETADGHPSSLSAVASDVVPLPTTTGSPVDCVSGSST